MADYIFLLETRLSREQQAAVQTLQEVTRAAGLNLYLTGGTMRDLLTAKPVRYLDFTTEGNPVGVVKALQAVAERMSPHGAQRSLNFSLRGQRARLRAARGDEGGGNGTIVEDLRRRGLTVNSIGLSLNQGSRGLLIDPANGIADIEPRLIRMNHPYVFLDDPIFLLRAVRLRHRLDFAIEERTAARMESARDGNYLERVTAESLGLELEAIAYEPEPGAALKALETEGWLEPAYGKGLRTGKLNMAALSQLTAVIEAWEQLGLVVDAGLATMPFMLGPLPAADQNRLAQLLSSRHLAEEWKQVPADAAHLLKRLMQRQVTSTVHIHELIEKTKPEAVVYATLAPAEAKAGKKLKEFQAHAVELRRRLPLGVLRAAGLAPGSEAAEKYLAPLYRRLLEGDTITDVEMAEQVRAQVAPPPAPAAAKAAKAALKAKPGYAKETGGVAAGPGTAAAAAGEVKAAATAAAAAGKAKAVKSKPAVAKPAAGKPGGGKAGVGKAAAGKRAKTTAPRTVQWQGKAGKEPAPRGRKGAPRAAVATKATNKAAPRKPRG